MSDLKDLYQEVILDHNRNPRNCYIMDGASCTADGHNPLCGDIVKVYLRIENGVIEEISFQGQGCEPKRCIGLDVNVVQNDQAIE